MNKREMLLRWLPFFASIMLLPVFAFATLPKGSWSIGEVLRSTDLNNNFQHVEAALRGGSHTLIANADVSASAAIQNTKLKAPTPKGVTQVATCAAGTCTLRWQQPTGFFTSVVYAGATGTYTATMSSARAGDGYYSVVAAVDDTSGVCSAAMSTSSQITVTCFTNAGVAANKGFTLIVYDNDPLAGE